MTGATTTALIRIGIPASFAFFAGVIRQLPGAASLVSANAFYDHSGGRFRRVRPDLFGGLSVALDSAGFVAMLRYRGYPWTLQQYVTFAGSFPWDWWAAPDFCCEPQIAHDRAEVSRPTARSATSTPRSSSPAWRKPSPPPR